LEIISDYEITKKWAKYSNDAQMKIVYTGILKIHKIEY
jgi:hypothetical protein